MRYKIYHSTSTEELKGRLTESKTFYRHDYYTGLSVMNSQVTVYYWGPLLFKTKVKPEDVKAVRKICDAATKKYNTALSAIIDDEVLADKAKYIQIMQPYLTDFKKAYKTWYNRTITKIIINSSWVNYMKKRRM